MDWLVHLLTGWVKQIPMVSTLLVLIGIDVFSGSLVAVTQRKLNSTTSWRGMSRKIIIMLLIGVGAVLQPFAQGLPLANMISMFYIVTESISILENAGALGVPLPSFLMEVLLKMKDSERDRSAQKTNTMIVTPPVIVVPDTTGKSDPGKSET